MNDAASTGATRYAIYFTPDIDSALGQFGADWMGAHPITGEPRTRQAIPGIEDDALAEFVRRPANYGFHGTLKAPFYMTEKRDRAGLVAHLAKFAEARQTFALPGLTVRALGAFVALGSKKRVAAMDSLAADCVRKFDAYRAPLTDQERERRSLASSLSARQKSLLEEHGYPYVLDQFDFHMTLAGPLDPGERDLIVKALSKEHKAVWKESVSVSGVSLCEQEYGDPFRITERFPFGA